MKTIRVVAAVICDKLQRKTKIFATARGDGDQKGGWEFPGGKIERVVGTFLLSQGAVLCRKECPFVLGW